MPRICASCNRNLPQTSYTANQWSKGDGVSRRAGCVHGHYSDNPSARQSDSGRYNNSNYAEFEDEDLEYPFAPGAFRWVARAATSAVPAMAKPSGAVFEEDYFSLDIKAIDKALEIANRFNQLNVIDKQLKINVARVWTFDSDSGCDWAGQKTLTEPFIQNYQKFNSNTGWNDDTRAWGRAMQALSHFSYHISGGNYVLCDLQGGIYQHEVVLSDPVILSQTREYGVTDLGPDGIRSFFSQHDCNNFCRPNWTKPSDPQQFFNPVPGTTMISRTVSTAWSKPYRTRYYG